MGINCVINEDGCLVCPALPEIARVDAHNEITTDIGWDSAANSTATLDGDLRLFSTMPPGASGAVLGLRYGRARPTLPDLIGYGFYFFQSGGEVFTVWEAGIQRTAQATRASSDTFEVRRVGLIVTYWHNGALIYTSALQSAGAMIATACLFASGDKVPA